MDQGALLPWTLAGHVRGGWVRLDDDRGTLGRLLPGAAGAETPPWPSADLVASASMAWTSGAGTRSLATRKDVDELGLARCESMQ